MSVKKVFGPWGTYLNSPQSAAHPLIIMAVPSVLYGDMFKSMKDLEIPMSVKQIFGPWGTYLTTWGEVDEFMQQLQAGYIETGHHQRTRCIRLLQKLRELYIANEARKASNK